MSDTTNLLNNKYEILKSLDEETGGTIYLAKDVNTQSSYVIKEIKEQLDEGLYNSMLYEFTTTVKNNESIEKKENAPKMVDFFIDGSRCYLVIEYNNRSLKRLKAYPSLGKTLKNRYMIIKGIASGGFGVVYLSKDVSLKDKYWAIKEMQDQGGEPEIIEKSFREEANFLAKLDHPNIPSISHFFTHNNKHYLVMEYIKGETLKEKLKKLAPEEYFSEEQLIDWALELCNVLGYLHNLPNPVVFRDIKPDNIMITERGDVKLIDFGIARVFEGPKSKTTSHALLTEGYAPPEQWMGKAEPRSDIYSLGATLFHLLTKVHPREKAPNFPPPKELKEDISEEMNEIIVHSLEIVINKRYKNINDFKEALEKIKVKRKIKESITKALEYKNKEDYMEASFHYKKALEIDPGNEDILCSLGECYEKLGLKDEANKYIRKAIKIIPDPEKSKIIIKGENLVEADGEARGIVEITLLDEKGKAIPDTIVEIYSSKKEDFFDPLPPTNTEGKTIGKVSSYDYGISLITVKANGITLKEKAEFKFISPSTQFNNTIKIEKKKKKSMVPLLITLILIVITPVIFYIIKKNRDYGEVQRHLNNGSALIGQKAYDSAVKEYESALLINSNIGEARIALGDIYFIKKDFPQALNEYEKAIKLNPKDVSILNKITDIYIIQGELKKAGEALKQVLEKDPKNIDLLNKLSELYLKQKEYDKSLEIIRKLAKDGNVRIETVLSLGTLFLKNNNYDNSKECFNFVIKKDKNNIKAHKGLGQIYLKEKDYKNAINENSKIISLNSGDIETYIEMGKCYYEMKNYEESINRLKKCLNLVKEKEDKEKISTLIFNCYIALGKEALSKKEYKKAEENFTQGHILITDNKEAIEGLAKSYLGQIESLIKNGNYTSAEELCQKTLVLYPEGEIAEKANSYLIEISEATKPIYTEPDNPPQENPPTSPQTAPPDVM